MDMIKEPMDLEGNMKLVAGILLGIAFGITLVKSELSWRKTIIGQYEMKDNTFFRTLFCSLATGILLFYFAEQAGMVTVNLRPSFFWGAALGGFVCAFGLALCGLTPSTAVASIASGRLYAIWVFAGMLMAIPVIQIVSDFLSGTVYKWPPPFAYENTLSQLFSNSNFFLWVAGVSAVMWLFFEFMPVGGGKGGGKEE